jgi:predicted transport protein
MAKLDHPLKPQIEQLRRLMAAADPAIREEIKWNSVTFRTTESFATVHLRSTARLQIVFHLGAKTKGSVPKAAVPDPGGIVRWLAPDRCLVTVGQLALHRVALQEIVQAWLPHVRGPQGS